MSPRKKSTPIASTLETSTPILSTVPKHTFPFGQLYQISTLIQSTHQLQLVNATAYIYGTETYIIDI